MPTNFHYNFGTTRAIGGYDMIDEMWWATGDTSRYERLRGEERYGLMLNDFRNLCAELEN